MYIGSFQTKEPKAILRISELNVAFAPKKVGHPNSLQITFLKDGSTRHIYVYHDDPETVVNWYMAIRSAKFNRLHVAYPSANESEVRDFLLTLFSISNILMRNEGPDLVKVTLNAILLINSSWLPVSKEVNTRLCQRRLAVENWTQK